MAFSGEDEWRSGGVEWSGEQTLVDGNVKLVHLFAVGNGKAIRNLLEEKGKVR